MKLYIYSFRSGKLEEQVAEAKECAKTYVTLEDAIGGFYKGSRIRKESIGSICGWSGNTIIFLEKTGMRQLKNLFREKERKKNLQRHNLILHRNALRILKI